MEKYGTAGQATDDKILRRMRIACWINKATDTHSEYVLLIVFPRHPWLRDTGLNITFMRTLLLVCC